MTFVGCQGNEDSIIKYSNMSGIGVDDCYYGKDLRVICLGNKKGIKEQLSKLLQILLFSIMSLYH